MPSANRLAKEKLVSDLHDTFSNVPAAILSKWSGITVEEVTALRQELRDKKVNFRVLKNKLALRAIEGTPLETMRESFQGPTVLAYTDADAVDMAKTLADFAKKTDDRLTLESGVLDGKLLEKKDVVALAALPSREVLLARLVGSLQSPYAGLVYTLSGVLRKLVYALDAVRRQKEEQGK